MSASLARRSAWIGLAVGLGALAVGLALVVASAAAAGDWFLARQPWIGLGLGSVVVGLALTAVCGIALDVMEPVGRLRWLAAVPTLVVGSFWAGWLLVGVATTRLGGAVRDIGTILYTLPEMLVLMVIATLAILVPLATARFRRVS